MLPEHSHSHAETEASKSHHHDPRRSTGRVRQRVEDDGEGNWLVSYADMMTLLFGFFVMISAFSKPDAAKLEQLKQATAKSMGVKYTNPYEALSKELSQILRQENLEEEIQMRVDTDGITIISRGTLFFDSASTKLKDKSFVLTKRIATMLTERAKKRPFRVTVEGHTDDLPMFSKQFPSNWELSASRASTVVRLFESVGFAHDALRPVGLSDTEPSVPNRTETGAPIAENQSQNRRIVIRVHGLQITDTGG